jgi:hypothetical protein
MPPTEPSKMSPITAVFVFLLLLVGTAAVIVGVIAGIRWAISF